MRTTTVIILDCIALRQVKRLAFWGKHQTGAKPATAIESTLIVIYFAITLIQKVHYVALTTDCDHLRNLGVIVQRIITINIIDGIVVIIHEPTRSQSRDFVSVLEIINQQRLAHGNFLNCRLRHRNSPIDSDVSRGIGHRSIFLIPADKLIRVFSRRILFRIAVPAIGDFTLLEPLIFDDPSIDIGKAYPIAVNGLVFGTTRYTLELRSPSTTIVVLAIPIFSRLELKVIPEVVRTKLLSIIELDRINYGIIVITEHNPIFTVLFIKQCHIYGVVLCFMGSIIPPRRIAPVTKGIDIFCGRILGRYYTRIFRRFAPGIFSRLQNFGTVDKGDRIEFNVFGVFAICNRRCVGRHIHHISINFRIFINVRYPPLKGVSRIACSCTGRSGRNLDALRTISVHLFADGIAVVIGKLDRIAI